MAEDLLRGVFEGKDTIRVIVVPGAEPGEKKLAFDAVVTTTTPELATTT
jgi:hypothetical protein